MKAFLTLLLLTIAAVTTVSAYLNLDGPTIATALLALAANAFWHLIICPKID
jgi:hypothetical protein